AVLDIGGGSTEISVVSSGTVVDGLSLPFGGARLAGRLYLQEDAADSRACPRAIALVGQQLRKDLYPGLNSRRLGTLAVLPGSSGTVRALLAFISKGATRGEFVSREEIAGAREELTRLSPQKIQKRLAAGKAWRWSHLLGASLIVEESMHALGSERIA